MKNVSIQINVPKKIVNVETSLFSVWVSDVGTHRIVWLSRECVGSGTFGTGPTHRTWIGEVPLTLVLMYTYITLVISI